MENGPESAPRPAPAGSLNGGFDRRRMMREIIDYQYSSDFRLHIHSALHAAERRERFGYRIARDTAPLRNYNCRQGVQDVVPPSGGYRKFSKPFSPMLDPKPHGIALKGKAAPQPIISLRANLRLPPPKNL